MKIVVIMKWNYSKYYFSHTEDTVLNYKQGISIFELGSMIVLKKYYLKINVTNIGNN